MNDDKEAFIPYRFEKTDNVINHYRGKLPWWINNKPVLLVIGLTVLFYDLLERTSR